MKCEKEGVMKNIVMIYCDELRCDALGRYGESIWNKNAEY